METEHSFTYIVRDGKGNIVESTIKNTNAVTLSEILEAFESYLKGCGFCFNGYLDIVEDESLDYLESNGNERL